MIHPLRVVGKYRLCCWKREDKLLEEIGHVAGRDRICCWKRQNKLLEEIGYVVETVSIFGRTTAVVRLHNS